MNCAMFGTPCLDCASIYQSGTSNRALQYFAYTNCNERQTVVELYLHIF